MTDYTKLVKALRERAGRENEWYEHGGDIIKAAADAIEALQAQLPKREEVWQEKTGSIKVAHQRTVKWEDKLEVQE